MNKRVGRPRIESPMKKLLSISLSEELKTKFVAIAKDKGVSISKLIRDSVLSFAEKKANYLVCHRCGFYFTEAELIFYTHNNYSTINFCMGCNQTIQRGEI